MLTSSCKMLWAAATTAALLLLFTCTTCVHASKDDSYYPAGVYNPNVENSMYWKDSKNVLQDLSSFSKLYVQYHGCTWSPLYKQDYYNQDYTNVCHQGEDIDGDEDLWYLGTANCHRANVAWSLYGILKGHRDRGCQRATFINSFFTIGGVEAWIAAMQSKGQMTKFTTSTAFTNENNNNNQDRRNLASWSATTIGSYCSVGNGNGDGRDLHEEQEHQRDLGYNANGGWYSNWGNGGNGGGNNGNYYYNNNGGDNDGDYSNYANGQAIHTSFGSLSYGVGCQEGKYRMFEFYGGFCLATDAIQVVDDLDAFNAAIEKDSCVEIYNGDSSAATLQILQESRACSTEFSSDCPDPYGKVSGYAYNYHHGTFMGIGGSRAGLTGRYLFGAALFGLVGTAALVYLWLAATPKGRTVTAAVVHKVQSFRSRKGRNPTPDKDDEDDDAAPKYKVQGGTGTIHFAPGAAMPTSPARSQVGQEQEYLDDLAPSTSGDDTAERSRKRGGLRGLFGGGKSKSKPGPIVITGTFDSAK